MYIRRDRNRDPGGFMVKSGRLTDTAINNRDHVCFLSQVFKFKEE